MILCLQPMERAMALTNELSTNESGATARAVTPAAASKTRAGRKSKIDTKGKGIAEPADSSRGAAPIGKPTPKTKLVTQPAETKTSIVIRKLNSPRGVTIEVLMEATGWQAHSMRGFLSAVIRKKLGLNLISEIGKDGIRRYRIDDAAARTK
jgi:hypothetical protein